MKKRFFAFGCSFTSYHWPTWADYVGVNFDEYYNFAVSGGSNSMILYQFIRALDRYNFNSEQDYVAVMFTTHHRYSFLNNNGQWITNGDVLRGHVELDWLYSFFTKNLWSIEFGVFQSWISAKTIKEILVKRNIQHKFMMIDSEKESPSINTLHNNNNESLIKFNELVLENKSFTESRLEHNNPTYFLDDSGKIYADTHPSALEHYVFFQNNFKEFDTDISKKLYEEASQVFSDNVKMYHMQIKNILNKYIHRQENF